MLRVRLLGGLELEGDAGAIEPPSGRPARALLAWLALHHGTHVRSRVAAALWPDVRDESARLSLRTALSTLREALGEEAEAVATTREHIRLAPGVRVDVDEFEALVAAGRFEEALALNRGELLCELDQEWVLEARDEWRHRVGEAIARLADAEEESGDLEAAVRRSRELLAIDPLSEEAQRALIRRLAALGERAGSLAAFERFRERLRRELGIAPSAETRDLVARVRQGAIEQPADTAREPPAMPPIVARRRRTMFVGRNEELRQLRESWQLAGRGERQLVVVGGEPGIGKTRLAAELADHAHAEGATVLFGRCSEEPLLPYQPFAEALRSLIASGSSRRLGELARLLPGLRDRGSIDAAEAEAPQSARFRLFEAVSSQLTEGCRDRSLLLVLEDLQWADKPTLLLLSHVAGAPERARLLILATYRETELPSSEPLAELLAELRRERLGARLHLSGLDEAEVHSLVSNWTGQTASADLVAQIHRRTEGNPFFIEEVLSQLSEGGAGVLEARVPQGVKEVVGRRVARLATETQRVLAAASVLGRRFDVAALAAVVEASPTGALEEAADTGLVADEDDRAGSYIFSHALVRETLYEQLTGARRAELHRRAARALERLHGPRPDRVGEIAHHLLAAGTPTSTERGIRYAVRAGELALNQLAYEDAASQFERALRALEHAQAVADSRRCELLLSLGDARMRAGERSDGRAAFGQAARVARALGRADLLAHAALGLGGMGVTVAAPDQALTELLTEALRCVSKSDAALRARLRARLALERYYVARGETEALSAEAVSLARQVGDERVLAEVLNARHVALWTPDHVEQRVAIADEMVEVAEAAGDHIGALQGRNWRILDRFELGQIDTVERELAAYELLADELKLPTYRWYVPLWRSTLAVLRGRFDEARDRVDEAFALGRRAQEPNAELFHQIVVTYHLPIEEGRFDGADLKFQRRKLVDSQVPHVAAAYRAGVARILAGRGQIEEAQHELDLVVPAGYAALPKDVNWLGTLVTAAEVAATVGHTGHAEVLYDLLLPYAQRNVVEARAIYCYGSGAYFVGTLAASLGRLADAVGHFEAARDAHERMSARPPLCRTLCRQAEVLLEMDHPGDRRRARELAREALEIARKLAIPSLIERAEAAAGAGSVSGTTT